MMETYLDTGRTDHGETTCGQVYKLVYGIESLIHKCQYMNGHVTLNGFYLNVILYYFLKVLIIKMF